MDGFVVDTDALGAAASALRSRPLESSGLRTMPRGPGVFGHSFLAAAVDNLVVSATRAVDEVATIVAGTADALDASAEDFRSSDADIAQAVTKASGAAT